jgi:hypothetical protein
LTHSFIHQIASAWQVIDAFAYMLVFGGISAYFLRLDYFERKEKNTETAVDFARIGLCKRLCVSSAKYYSRRADEFQGEADNLARWWR